MQSLFPLEGFYCLVLSFVLGLMEKSVKQAHFSLSEHEYFEFSLMATHGCLYS